MKKILLALVLAFMVPITTPLNSYAGEYIGTYCFQLDNYPVEVFEWAVEAVGNTYQFTGSCPYFDGGMDGAGTTNASNVLNFVITEADPDGWRRICSFALNLSTLTGTTDFQWFDSEGTLNAVYNDEPFSLISCPPSDADLKAEGPNSRQ